MTNVIEARVRCRKLGCSRRFTRPQGSRRIYCPECSPPRKPAEVAEDQAPSGEPTEGPIVAAVRAELVSLDVLGMVESAIALRLALSLDDPKLAASSVSAMSGQLTKVLAGLRERAPRQPDRLDEIGQRLAAKMGKAGKA